MHPRVILSRVAGSSSVKRSDRLESCVWLCLRSLDLKIQARIFWAESSKISQGLWVSLPVAHTRTHTHKPWALVSFSSCVLFGPGCDHLMNMEGETDWLGITGLDIYDTLRMLAFSMNRAKTSRPTPSKSLQAVAAWVSLVSEYLRGQPSVGSVQKVSCSVLDSPGGSCFLSSFQCRCWKSCGALLL